MGAQGIVETKYLSNTYFYFQFNHHGQGYEGNEGHGCHEGHESHEEEGCQQDRQGQNGQVCGFPWNQGEDRRWLDQDRFGEEQEWKDCEQEAHASGKKAYANIKGWTVAVQKARKALNVKGFVAVKKGSPLYKKAKEFFN